MQRHQRITNTYDFSKRLDVRFSEMRAAADRYILQGVAEDVGTGDATARLLPAGPGTAVITAKQSGIIAGVDEIVWAAKKLRLKTTVRKKDGARVQRGDVVLRLSGPSHTLLSTERTFLNVMQRMSGIATATHAAVRKAGGRVGIAGTRKTLLGLLDKKAVAVGGGLTHRLNLHTGVMIKENHIALAGGLDALGTLDYNADLPCILEVETLTEMKRVFALELDVDALLLDNFSPAKLTVAMQWLRKNDYHDRYVIEASGGISPKTIAAYSRTGVDVLSLGYLTHSVTALDLSMRFQ